MLDRQPYRIELVGVTCDAGLAVRLLCFTSGAD